MPGRWRTSLPGRGSPLARVCTASPSLVSGLMPRSLMSILMPPANLLLLSLGKESTLFLKNSNYSLFQPSLPPNSGEGALHLLLLLRRGPRTPATWLFLLLCLLLSANLHVDNNCFSSAERSHKSKTKPKPNKEQSCVCVCVCVCVCAAVRDAMISCH